MQLHPASVPVSPRMQLLNPPGMTPMPQRITAPPALLAPLPADVGGDGGRGAGPRQTRERPHRLLEFLEDAVLLLGIVFMVPVVIMLLALPFALVLQIAAEIGRRW